MRVFIGLANSEESAIPYNRAMTIRKTEKNSTNREKDLREKNREDDWELEKTSGGKQTFEELKEDNQAGDLSLYGDDLDAGWKNDQETGEEVVSGSVITPDKDQVSEIGEGIGLTYRDDEELDSDQKIKWKEAQRWEPSQRTEGEE